MYIQLQNRKEAQQPLNLNSISKEEIAPVETIIKAAGLDGIYQKKILCILIIQFFVGAFFHTGLYYQLLDPSNHCFDNPQIAMASPCKDQAQCFEELQKARVLDKVGYTVSYQFSLVCDRKKYAHYISIFYWLGGLCGTLYYSNVSQKRGRRKALIEAMSLSGLSAIVGSFSFNYFIFMATTFCSAFGYYGSTNAAFILISEQFSQFWRRLSPGLVMAFNCLGSIAMSYWWRYLQEWQFWLMYATGLPLLVSSLLLFFIQQSPRYLVNKGRFKQAMEMIIKIAEKNDRKLIDFQFEEQVREMKVQKKLHETIQSIVGKNRVAVENIPNFGNILTSQNIGNFSSVSDHTFYSLWKYESLKRKTLILLYLWGLFHFTNVITTDTFI